MKINDLLKNKQPLISFEIFPPKTQDAIESVEIAAQHIATLKPDFMSITYGASGGTSEHTVHIASMVQNQLNVTALAHLTCVSSTKEQVKFILNQLKAKGIENILALRGDIPEDVPLPQSDYKYAFELINLIKSEGDFCIGAACYPEGHVQNNSKKADIEYLKQKVDCGCDFLTTQMFFDNNILYNYLYQIREKGVSIPVIAGIMPVTNSKQIARICKLSGTALPERFKRIVDKFGENPAAMQQAGIAYATEQIIDLVANDIRGIHVYSMNKPEIAQGIMNNLSEVLC